MSFIEESLFTKLLKCSVNVCVDVVVKYKGQYVFVTRKDEPMKGVAWPVGGRIMKGEPAQTAATRKLFDELGIYKFSNLRPIGYYEDEYDKNSFYADTSYHTISIVFECEIDSVESLIIDKTSEKWGLYDTLPERFNIVKFME